MSIYLKSTTLSSLIDLVGQYDLVKDKLMKNDYGKKYYEEKGLKNIDFLKENEEKVENTPNLSLIKKSSRKNSTQHRPRNLSLSKKKSVNCSFDNSLPNFDPVLEKHVTQQPKVPNKQLLRLSIKKPKDEERESSIDR